MAADAHNPTGSAEAIINPHLGFEEVTERIMRPPLARGFRPLWLIGFGLSAMVMLVGVASAAWLLIRGVGVWGIGIPVAWGFAIINFVWWIGIGHAGTLISAILLLLRQEWRTSINRFAEAMTLFAVACAGLFPLMHLGRITRFYYLFPYPSTMSIWPQWRSPLVWDVFAVMTYGTVSLIFWYLGLVPDLATMRDRGQRKSLRILSGVFSLGWRGSARHWQRYQMVYLLLAGLATPLVVSVHSIVSLDFSVGIVPGWHTTIFPPYFVAGAIYSGFAMVIILAIPIRWAFGFHDLITNRHLELMAKVMLTVGLIVGYGYLMETFTAWFSGDVFEQFIVKNRALGPYAPVYWATIACNIGAVQVLWFRRARRSPLLLFILALIVSVGMWTERYVIVIISLHRDFLTSSWGMYSATFWDWTLFIGTIGLFATLMFVFVRFLPSISAFEVRELLHHKRHEGGHAATAHPVAAVGDTPTEEQSYFDTHPDAPVYGIAGEFEEPDKLKTAAQRARERGFTRMEGYTPFPIDGLSPALGHPPTRIPQIALAGAIIGGCTAYFMQWYTAVQDYPINVGGRPLHSWPSFIPLTFELAVLGAATFMLVGLIVRNRFPAPYHPIFDAPGFRRASSDRFFLCIEARDPLYSEGEVERFFEECGALRASRVPLRTEPRETIREAVTVTT